MNTDMISILSVFICVYLWLKLFLFPFSAFSVTHGEPSLSGFEQIADLGQQLHLRIHRRGSRGLLFFEAALGGVHELDYQEHAESDDQKINHHCDEVAVRDDRA